jgi:hypothetical protein
VVQQRDGKVTTGVSVDLEGSAREVAVLGSGTGDEQLSAVTPCPEYVVRELLAHLVGLTAAFRDAAKKEFGPTTGTGYGPITKERCGTWRGVSGLAGSGESLESGLPGGV